MIFGNTHVGLDHIGLVTSVQNRSRHFANGKHVIIETIAITSITGITGQKESWYVIGVVPFFPGSPLRCDQQTVRYVATTEPMSDQIKRIITIMAISAQNCA